MNLNTLTSGQSLLNYFNEKLALYLKIGLLSQLFTGVPLASSIVHTKEKFLCNQCPRIYYLNSGENLTSKYSNINKI